jgi:hypothetical protein
LQSTLEPFTRLPSRKADMNAHNKLTAARSAAALITALAAVLSGGAIAGAATLATSPPSVAKTAAPKPGHWSRITANGLANINEVGLVRGGDQVLHVLWLGGNISGHYAIMDTPVAADGAVGKTTAIASHIFLAGFPDATATKTGLDVFWNADQTSAPGSLEGTFDATRPGRGGSWRAGGVVPTVNLDWGDVLSAATGSDGRPWVDFGVSGGIAALHYGHAERMIVSIPSAKCCGYEEGMGVDGRTGAAWATWYWLMDDSAGIYTQRIAQSGAPVGRPSRVPDTSDVIGPKERVTAIGRGKNRPGVYISYLPGGPFARSVDVYELGAKSPLTVVKLPFENDIGLSTLAADPEGRIWVAWAGITNDESSLTVARSNAEVTTFAKAQRVGLPSGTEDVWKVYLSAQTGRLDVVALLTVHGKEAYWTTQVLPAASK